MLQRQSCYPTQSLHMIRSKCLFWNKFPSHVRQVSFSYLTLVTCLASLVVVSSTQKRVTWVSRWPQHRNILRTSHMNTKASWNTYMHSVKGQQISSNGFISNIASLQKHNCIGPHINAILTNRNKRWYHKCRSKYSSEMVWTNSTHDRLHKETDNENINK